MNKLIIGLILIVVNQPFNTKACSCIGENTVEKEVHKSDVVFTGKVLSKNVFTVNDNNLPTGLIVKKAEYTILVTKLYKGVLVSDTIKIITGVGSGDCGYEFLIGFEYIIYSVYSEKYFESGQKVDKFFHTDICSRTRRIEKKELRKIKRYSTHKQ
jgi:hypothetical protein